MRRKLLWAVAAAAVLLLVVGIVIRVNAEPRLDLEITFLPASSPGPAGAWSISVNGGDPVSGPIVRRLADFSPTGVAADAAPGGPPVEIAVRAAGVTDEVDVRPGVFGSSWDTYGDSPARLRARHFYCLHAGKRLDPLVLFAAVDPDANEWRVIVLRLFRDGKRMPTGGSGGSGHSDVDPGIEAVFHGRRTHWCRWTVSVDAGLGVDREGLEEARRRALERAGADGWWNPEGGER